MKEVSAWLEIRYFAFDSFSIGVCKDTSLDKFAASGQRKLCMRFSIDSIHNVSSV